MFNIIICGGNYGSTDKLKDTISEYFELKGQEYKISEMKTEYALTKSDIEGDVVLVYADRAYMRRKIMFMSNDGEMLLYEDEIYYFIINGRNNVVVGLKEREINIKESLSAIMKKLSPNRFFMCHRSCIINLQYVNEIRNKYDIIMENGSFCPLSQRRKGALIKTLERYIK